MWGKNVTLGEWTFGGLLGMLEKKSVDGDSFVVEALGE
jgi:hypothetical protein